MSVWVIAIGYFVHILPTKAIIVEPFLAVFGGEYVFQSIIFTLTSALAGAYDQRAPFFSYISSTSCVVSFMSPIIASATMSWNILLPFWINIGLLAFAIPTIVMLPETTKSTLIGSSSLVYKRFNSDDLEEGPLLAKSEGSSSRYANVLLCSFFLATLASSDTKLHVQYISKRYEWMFTQASFILSAKAIINFTLLAIVVPRLIDKSVSTRAVHGSEVRLDYLGAEASILISVISVLCVALVFKFLMQLAALMIYALGSALPVFTMSLVKSQLIALADSDTQDFSIVMLTKTLNSLAIGFGGVGLGLPYFTSAVTHISAAIVVARFDGKGLNPLLLKPQRRLFRQTPWRAIMGAS
ncbi:hypothetical protein BU25DRAFT_417304 [Macroventuria anomochaeta]|uniref:Uncharacterized protein n=1 Tax=Macroventuria anomochaeta TaxID=301207 RepID=A0ACB6SHY8_9PLEO|nr:uncharacterized protein BU25DRAFT_417304 [Macroventuria anomochaeta]KAF2632707.1 hypothetical protein BU25DRAFT_417304 [Macroventuria anomochaeta]